MTVEHNQTELRVVAHDHHQSFSQVMQGLPIQYRRNGAAKVFCPKEE